MTQLLALLILWILPWQSYYSPDIAGLRVQQGCHPQYITDGQVAYYDGYHQVIRLCSYQFSSLRHIMVHESQHHMQLVEKMALWPSGYDAFEEAVIYELTQTNYPPGTSATIRSLIDAPEPIATYNELHAELPWILDMQIPDSLRPWYPWFD